MGGRDMQNQMELISAALKEWGYESPVFVGEGAFARVYRIRESSTKVFYACKVSREREMLRREGEMLEGLSHPLFPKYVTLRECGDLSFLIMEYIPGQSLAAMMTCRGWLTKSQVLRVAIALAEGLAYLHESNPPIIFRDMKPENIFIGENGSVRLLDLGSACAQENAGRAITGTVGYAAPEQWEKPGNIGFHSDVYALGRVIFVMVGAKQDEREYRELAQLAKKCTREDIGERIPNVLMVLYKLKECNRQKKIGKRDVKRVNEYSYQQNVLRY